MGTDLATIDALARVQLIARRLGFEVRVCHASRELVELIEFTGFGEVLRVEPCGQVEQREQLLGPEEEGELGDSTA